MGFDIDDSCLNCDYFLVLERERVNGPPDDENLDRDKRRERR